MDFTEMYENMKDFLPLRSEAADINRFREELLASQQPIDYQVKRLSDYACDAGRVRSLLYYGSDEATTEALCMIKGESPKKQPLSALTIDNAVVVEPAYR